MQVAFVASLISHVAAGSVPGMVGTNPCTDGPDYWCSSLAHAVKCGFKDPFRECQKYCGDMPDSIFCEAADILIPVESDILGQDPCTWGPSYWCASRWNAIECGTEDYDCNTPIVSPAPLGQNPCTWGPSYWCASRWNAIECGTEDYDCNAPIVSPTPLGENPCTWGPSYWCASRKNAIECGTEHYDCGVYAS
eukprot:CFRG6622T1